VVGVEDLVDRLVVRDMRLVRHVIVLVEPQEQVVIMVVVADPPADPVAEHLALGVEAQFVLYGQEFDSSRVHVWDLHKYIKLGNNIPCQ